jgi:hypothetical protein
MDKELKKALDYLYMAKKPDMQYFENYSDSGNFDDTYQEGHICGTNFGYNQAVDEINKAIEMIKTFDGHLTKFCPAFVGNGECDCGK